MKIVAFRKRVESLLDNLTREADPDFLVAVYFSFQTAETLGYIDDSMDADPDIESRMRRNLNSLNTDANSLMSLPEGDTRKWFAGHFFNNALIRLVALEEIALRHLLMKKDPHKYTKQALLKCRTINHYRKAYESDISAHPYEYSHLAAARRRVNYFKHERDDDSDKRWDLHKYDEGLEAFNELLKLLERHRVELGASV